MEVYNIKKYILIFSLVFILIASCTCISAEENADDLLDDDSDGEILDDNSDEGSTGDESIDIDVIVDDGSDADNHTSDDGDNEKEDVGVNLQKYATGNPLLALMMFTAILLPFRRHI